MAKKSLIVKCNKAQEKYSRALAQWKKPKFATKVYNRCKLCWRVHWYLWLFKMCRICFKYNADNWMIPWVTKSSW